jgi:ATP-dependent RNA helicase RhlE
MTFKDLNITEPILKAIEEKGYANPTPIQVKAIPAALTGKDILGCAQTGTGKTAAFAIPIIQHLQALKNRDKSIKALILTPTRELALQISECIDDYAKYTQVRHGVIFGGVNQRAQVNMLHKGVDILVATPGRLLDLMNQGYIHLDNVRHFVLDEADRMLDMGFIHDIKRLLPKLPKEKQTLFFSATMPDTIIALTNSLLKQPVKITITPKSSTVDTIEQTIYFVEKKEKSKLLISILHKTEGQSVLVFSRTKHNADRIVRVLSKAGIGSQAIHGNKSQNARQSALENFKTGKIRVMIATDIAARGIDINELPLVINYDLPDVPETYVHRIGRTGRAGNLGTALTFCSFLFQFAQCFLDTANGLYDVLVACGIAHAEAVWVAECVAAHCCHVAHFEQEHGEIR